MLINVMTKQNELSKRKWISDYIKIIANRPQQSKTMKFV